MLTLDDTRWKEIGQAPGARADIPALLKQLADFPAGGSGEPYASLSRVLLYQGCICPAAYAVVPHMVQMIEASPHRVHPRALLLLTLIEVARARGNGPQPEPALAGPYREALRRLPQALAATAAHDWNELQTRTAAAALAAAKGQAELAAAILALQPDRIPDFMDSVADDE